MLESLVLEIKKFQIQFWGLFGNFRLSGEFKMKIQENSFDFSKTERNDFGILLCLRLYVGFILYYCINYFSDLSYLNWLFVFFSWALESFAVRTVTILRLKNQQQKFTHSLTFSRKFWHLNFSSFRFSSRKKWKFC